MFGCMQMHFRVYECNVISIFNIIDEHEYSINCCEYSDSVFFLKNCSFGIKKYIHSTST